MKKLLSIPFLVLIASFIMCSQNRDWANLKYYKKANAALKDGKPLTEHVVFMGNSITENWQQENPDFFKENNYISRGISGQTTSQMLVRFQQDVVDLKPKAVVILAGINDIAENTGPITTEDIFENIVLMSRSAQENNIQVILCTVLPTAAFQWNPDIDPVEKIIQLNNLLHKYAEQEHIPIVNYYEAMVMPDKTINPDYAIDGLHPNLKGYKVMEPLVKREIQNLPE